MKLHTFTVNPHPYPVATCTSYNALLAIGFDVTNVNTQLFIRAMLYNENVTQGGVYMMGGSMAFTTNVVQNTMYNLNYTDLNVTGPTAVVASSSGMAVCQRPGATFA